MAINQIILPLYGIQHCPKCRDLDNIGYGYIEGYQNINVHSFSLFNEK